MKQKDIKVQKGRFLLLILFLFAVLGLQAQKLTVESFGVAQGDLDARSSETRRVDRNGTPCALVKVQLPLQGAVFDGVVGDVQFKAGEYWAYLPDGAYLLSIKHPQYHKLELNLRQLRPAEENFRGVEQLTTYNLVINVPMMGQAEVKKQKFVINYTPTDAMVLIDSKPYRGNGSVEVELSLGEHSYTVATEGYITAEGTVKLNGGPAYSLPISLAREEIEEQVPAQSTLSSEREPDLANTTDSLSRFLALNSGEELSIPLFLNHPFGLTNLDSKTTFKKAKSEILKVYPNAIIKKNNIAISSICGFFLKYYGYPIHISSTWNLNQMITFLSISVPNANRSLMETLNSHVLETLSNMGYAISEDTDSGLTKKSSANIFFGRQKWNIKMDFKNCVKISAKLAVNNSKNVNINTVGIYTSIGENNAGAIILAF